MKILGLIMAAGSGRRMGAPKALVKFRGRTLLDHVSGTLRDSRALNDVRVVVATDAPDIADEVKSLSLIAIPNAEAGSGMMSSLQAGVREARRLGFDAILVALVDQPLLLAETVTLLITEFRKQAGATLLRPRFAGQVGHPCLIRSQHFDDILRHPAGDVGAAFLFASHAGTSRLIDVDDLGVTADFDQPADVKSAEQEP